MAMRLVNTFAVIKNSKEMIKLQESIIDFLQQNKVMLLLVL